MNKIAYVFIPCSYNGPCITESGPKVFEHVLQKNNYDGDYYSFSLKWDESLCKYMERITNDLKEIVKSHDKIIVFGGNHLSLIPVYNIAGTLNYNSLTLDAHRDYLYNDGLITHGSFIRFLKKSNSKKFLLGFRDNAKDKYEFFEREISSIQYMKDRSIKLNNIKYIDIDVDVFDKKLFPYTVCAMDKGIQISHLFEIFENVEAKNVKILSFSEYAYVLDKKKKGLRIIMKVIDKFPSY